MGATLEKLSARSFLWSLMGFLVILSGTCVEKASANPDAKRLYDDLLSNYNRLIRPVRNHSTNILVKLGLRLSQLIELVSPRQKKTRFKNNNFVSRI